MLYLETGCKPIRFIIQARRVNYLQYILKEDQSSLVSKFFFAQNSQSLKNDWALTCRQDLKDLNINLSLEEIKRKSKQSSKTLVAKATTKRALNFLLEEKRKLSKVSHILLSELKIQKYLLPQTKDMRIAKFIFQARTRMLDIKANYGRKEPCLICQNPNTIDNQPHLLQCSKLCDNVIVLDGYVPSYEDLFGKDVKKIIRIGQILSQKFSRRKEIINKTVNQSM